MLEIILCRLNRAEDQDPSGVSFRRPSFNAMWFLCATPDNAIVSSAQQLVGRNLHTSQLLKGVLDLAVLAVLRDADGYGYDVVRRLRSAGLTEVGDASVYGTLRRLYRAGGLTTYVVPSDE